jgi:REP element-mobilizing transposase RayT
MTNHVHLLMMPPHTKDGIGKLMQSLGRYYVQYFNYQYEVRFVDPKPDLSKDRGMGPKLETGYSL